MKKVFRLWKFLLTSAELMKDDEGFCKCMARDLLNEGWLPECDGLTEEEMKKRGYMTDETWFVEEVSE